MAREKANRENRKAFHDYEIIETFEAGIALTGTGVLAARRTTASYRLLRAHSQGRGVAQRAAHLAVFAWQFEQSRPRPQAQAAASSPSRFAIWSRKRARQDWQLFYWNYFSTSG